MVSRIQRRPHDLGEDEEQEGEQDRQVRVRRLLLKVESKGNVLISNFLNTVTSFFDQIGRELKGVTDKAVILRTWVQILARGCIFGEK